MTITSTKLDGLIIIEPVVFEDTRGKFVKTFNEAIFAENNLIFDPKESYYSTSHKNVIRGMHFQLPPHDHAKLVYVTQGAITDVVLDIRKGSPTYGQFVAIELSQSNHKMVYIPVGFAHGFLSRQDGSCVVYTQTTMHSKEHDAGIRFNSFGFDWGVSEPIMSDRDKNFPDLEEFESPFVYQEKR